MNDRFLVDTNVLLYARGGQHPQRGPCRSVLRAAAVGTLSLEASVELVQEFTHVLLRRAGRRREVLAEVDDVQALCRLHAFDVDVLATMRSLLAHDDELGVRDAVHAATAIRAGVTGIISTDRVFDRVDAVSRLDPTTPDAPWASVS